MDALPPSRPGRAGVLWFLGTAMLFFGGAAGDWFSPSEESAWWVQPAKLAAGVAIMGVMVSLAGAWVFGRNAWLWGMVAPLLVYLGGTGAALAAGHPGATSLLLGAPLLAGFSMAAGLFTAFVADGLGAPARSR